jgi:anti-sigma-K factor RskA
MNRDDARELSGAYAIRALATEQSREVDAHLSDSQLREEIVALRATASALVLAAPEREPPAALRSRIMAAIAETDSERSDVLPIRVLEHRGSRRSYALTAVLGLFALGMLLWNVTLLHDTRSPQALAIVPSNQAPQGADQVRIVPSGPGEGTTLRYNSAEQISVLDVVDLLPLDETRTYQIWAIRGQGVMSVGTFLVAEDGSARVPFSFSPTDGDTLMVTEEPRGGSSSPTSEAIFTLRNLTGG